MPRVDSIKAARAELEKRKRKIAYHRDQLREWISDAEALAEDLDDAIGDIESAVESLSRYV